MTVCALLTSKDEMDAHRYVSIYLSTKIDVDYRLSRVDEDQGIDGENWWQCVVSSSRDCSQTRYALVVVSRAANGQKTTEIERWRSAVARRAPVHDTSEIWNYNQLSRCELSFSRSVASDALHFEWLRNYNDHSQTCTNSHTHREGDIISHRTRDLITTKGLVWCSKSITRYICIYVCVNFDSPHTSHSLTIHTCP